jgi:hypothetical protein
MSTEDDDDPDELDTDKRGRTPLEQWEKVPASPMPPIAPDGGIAPGYGVGLAPAVPAATPANFVCLRGPCRHYWEVHTFMASGNPSATWGEDGLKDEAGQPIRQPRQINRSCLSAPGSEMELTDDTVYFCNRWDPMTPRELRRREKPQQRHLKMHPELAALQPTALDLDDHDEEESHGAR